MGANVSDVRKNTREDDIESRTKFEQRLQILEKMVSGRLENQQSSIISGERGNQEIHSGTVVEVHRQVNIVISEKGDQDLEEAIGGFFSADMIKGIFSVVKMGINAVLGNLSMGEYDSSDMFVVWTNNALLRCDTYYYRWNFGAEGIVEKTEGAIGILLVKRVIDISSTDPQVLTWAVSRQAACLETPEKAGEMIDAAMEVLMKVQKFQLALAETKRRLNYEPSSESTSN